MKTGVVTTDKNQSIRAATDLMARNKIDSLVIVDEKDTYQGVITIKAIKAHGGKGTLADIKPHQTITTSVKQDARKSFDVLYNSDDDFIVVLNEDDTVAGFITRPSMAVAMADTLWGDVE